MPEYKLYYFNGRGRAEVTRWLFALGGVKYEDVRLTGEEWAKKKPDTPFGQLPVLEVDGKSIAQSNTISKYVAKLTNHMPGDPLEEAQVSALVDGVEDVWKDIAATMFNTDDKAKAAAKEKWDKELRDKHLGQFEKLLVANGDLMYGTKVTLADLAVVYILTVIDAIGGYNKSNFPALAALQDRVLALPKLAAWIKNRPETPF